MLTVNTTVASRLPLDGLLKLGLMPGGGRPAGRFLNASKGSVDELEVMNVIVKIAMNY